MEEGCQSSHFQFECVCRCERIDKRWVCGRKIPGQLQLRCWGHGYLQGFRQLKDAFENWVGHFRGGAEDRLVLTVASA